MARYYGSHRFTSFNDLFNHIIDATTTTDFLFKLTQIGVNLVFLDHIYVDLSQQLVNLSLLLTQFYFYVLFHELGIQDYSVLFLFIFDHIVVSVLHLL